MILKSSASQAKEQDVTLREVEFKIHMHCQMQCIVPEHLVTAAAASVFLMQRSNSGLLQLSDVVLQPQDHVLSCSRAF